ncbi:NAD-dependent epimerase/dehydratase family protein [Candidatus Pelagibacter sp.]|nr:NAD-dependent epimerase/dehydratase family protein [Candidatus Pelagibacter sp.]
MLFQEDKSQLRKFKKTTNLKLLNKKKILITGCNGFVGSSIIRILYNLTYKSNNKIDLYGIVRKNSKVNNLILKSLIKLNKIKIFKIDIHEKINLDFNPDIIIHCASVTAPHLYKKEPVETVLTNSLGTINLLNFAKKKKTKRFIFISAGEIYGDFKTQKKIVSENNFGQLDPSKITSNYGISKKFAENAIICWGKKYKIKTNSVRLFHTYGPLMKLGDGRIHSDLIKNVINKNNLLIKGNKNIKRSFCYISDVVFGILLVVLKGKNGESYNIANPNETIKIIQLANLISKISKQKITIKNRFTKTRNDFIYPKISIKKIKKLGWSPQISLRNGIIKTINFYESKIL